jgi:alanyl-tRNA synthetase
VTTRRLYYDDAFAVEFSAQVLNSRPASVSTICESQAPAWEVILDRTAFYPTSGGQPHDLGTLGAAKVLGVREQEDEIVHIVDRDVPPGQVQGAIDWPRRFDHMQQHTGQHLLSAMFHKHFHLPTVSFHLGAEVCTIDLRGPEPSEEILEGAGRRANQIVFENRPVKVRYGTAEQLSHLGVRKEVDRAGLLRAIEIEGVELQPCGGTHVKSTGQIGLILVRRCSKIRQDWRVEFVCGSRAAEVAGRDFQLLGQVAQKLNCAPDEVTSAASRVLSDRDANFKNHRALLQRLAEAEAGLSLQSAPCSPDGWRIVAGVLDEVSPEYAGFLATEIAKAEKSVALLAAKEGGQIVFAQHPSSGKDMNALLKQVFEKYGGKGGGTRDFARGKLAEASQAESALALAREKLSTA